MASLACQYGGAEGALISMGALNFVEEEELKGLVQSWRAANPHIVNYWYEIDGAVKAAVKEQEDDKGRNGDGIYQSGMLKIALPSGRVLSYVRPRMTVNRFGSESVCYEGIGTNRKWTRMESYGAKILREHRPGNGKGCAGRGNAPSGKRRDLISCATSMMKWCLKCRRASSVEEVNEIMAVCPDWCEGLPLKAAGFESPFYKKGLGGTVWEDATGKGIRIRPPIAIGRVMKQEKRKKKKEVKKDVRIDRKLKNGQKV